MWGDCAQCGHGPHRATHFWDRVRYTFCEVCDLCGQKRRDHTPYGHDFKRCPCLEYRAAA